MNFKRRVTYYAQLIISLLFQGSAISVVEAEPNTKASTASQQSSRGISINKNHRSQQSPPKYGTTPPAKEQRSLSSSTGREPASSIVLKSNPKKVSSNPTKQSNETRKQVTEVYINE